MSDDVPSPAPPKRNVHPDVDVSIDGLAKLPWHSALYASWTHQQAELDRALEEIKKLKVTLATLKRRLYEAKIRQENWLLRQQAWSRERSDLLVQAKKNGHIPQHLKDSFPGG